MKKLIVTVVFALLSISIFANPQAKISLIRGKVEIQDKNGNWIAAKENMEVPLQTMISTGFKSSAVITINEINMTVSPLTRLKIEELEQKGDTQSTAVFLQSGKVKTEVNSKEKKHDFKFRSPVSTASVRGTVFTFTGRTLIVHIGSVDFYNNIGQRVNIATGQGSLATSQSRPTSQQTTQGQGGNPNFVEQLLTQLENQFNFLKATGNIIITIEFPE
ncbi:MAG: FecR domain-containing protein [Spirochaetales bacterium]|nr:FecR domain-containing protein [Spirochaetales bacterium]